MGHFSFQPAARARSSEEDEDVDICAGSQPLPEVLMQAPVSGAAVVVELSRAQARASASPQAQQAAQRAQRAELQQGPGHREVCCLCMAGRLSVLLVGR